MSANSFIVYNASAGSGKTFTLVKSYLKTLLLSTDVAKYKRVLAITFTNKAVAEMKTRVLENLKAFANTEILSEKVPEALNDAHQMFLAIADELDVNLGVLHIKAKRVHNMILNNYAAFDIVTIDTFTHRIIRTFAHDLKLPQNFEVALDTEEILQEAINNVIAKVGVDKKLTRLLIDFATQKADDDKSWDISLDLFNVSKLLLNENEIQHINVLKDKTLNDFDALKKTITKNIEQIEKELVVIAKNRLSVFKTQGIQKSDFDRGSLYTHFVKLAALDLNVKFDTGWQNKLCANETLYPKRVDSTIALAIDAMQSAIADDFEKTKQLFFEIKFLKNFQNNIVPLSVLNVVNKELQRIKEEQNILLISEFNQIIANEIKGQPAPFIYERIGERYQNYFIDEFQDTSQMQWQNLVPLVENALITEPKQNEHNSLLIVGDAKQAIYRWRGGKPEQFIELYEEENPFYIHKKIANLDTNYRSYSEVVDFNNSFFSFLSNRFELSTHKELYKIGNQQKQNSKKGGFVQLSFIENVVEEEATKLYQEKVLTIIENVLNEGFCKADICIVTRKKKDGVAIADYLTDKNIAIISSETLLIDKSAEVKFVISFLSYLLNPSNKNYKIELLCYLFSKLTVEVSEHKFYEELLVLSPAEFFKHLAINYQIQFDYNSVQTLPLYELVEQVIRSFRLVDSSDAYIQYFLDEVLSFSQKKASGIQGFLEYWELKKDKLSIVAPQGADAVTIMTIHKSKGLEFPIVIVPFAELDVYKEQNAKIWYPINGQQFNGFSEAFLNFNKEVASYSSIGNELTAQRKSQLELDNINLLYVALTRPKEQLYIITKKNVSTKTGEENTNFFSGFFIGYLKNMGEWKESINDFTFGSIKKQSKQTKIPETGTINFVSSSRSDHNLSVLTKNGYLWDTNQEEAIEKGNLIHLALSKIKYKNDVDIALQELFFDGVLNKEQEDQLKPLIKKVINTPALTQYFEETKEVFNEKPIITASGEIIIPDRVIIEKNNATIITLSGMIIKRGCIVQSMNNR